MLSLFLTLGRLHLLIDCNNGQRNLTCYLNVFSAPDLGPQIILAPTAPAPQHWYQE